MPNQYWDEEAQSYMIAYQMFFTQQLVEDTQDSGDLNQRLSAMVWPNLGRALGECIADAGTGGVVFIVREGIAKMPTTPNMAHYVIGSETANSGVYVVRMIFTPDPACCRAAIADPFKVIGMSEGGS